MVDQAEIHRMAGSEDVEERKRATKELKNNFAILTDKKQACDDLHHLTSDTENNGVRRGAAVALGSVFEYMPDTKQVWEDLQGLTLCKKSRFSDPGFLQQLMERSEEHGGYCPSFSEIESAERNESEFELEAADTRASSYHSLGKISIYMASDSAEREEFKKKLEEAIGFFEEASNEATHFNPASFCLPFYRSFFALIFRKEEAEAEVQKFISEAKGAVQGSESKEKLLEAVENLGKALKETQKARDFSAVKSDLNAYRRYCDRACELLDTTEDKAPGASRLIRRGLPIIDERIKGIIAEIQEKAKALCKQTKGTTFEDLGKNVYRIGQNLLVENPVILEKRLNDLQISLSAICARTSEINVGEVCDLLKRANNEPILENRIQLMDDAISKILPHIKNLPNIQILNSNNVQITTANGTTQKMSIEISDEKTKK